MNTIKKLKVKLLTSKKQNITQAEQEEIDDNKETYMSY